MISGTARNLRVLEELQKTLIQDEQPSNTKTYTFTEYAIDGRKYASLSGLRNNNIKHVSPEEKTIEDFSKMLQTSSDPGCRCFNKTINTLVYQHKSGGDVLKDTPLYATVKEYLGKVLATRAGSVERDFLMVAAVGKIKNAYKDMVTSEA